MKEFCMGYGATLGEAVIAVQKRLKERRRR
jgi:hypothetical protein